MKDSKSILKQPPSTYNSAEKAKFMLERLIEYFEEKKKLTPEQ